MSKSTKFCATVTTRKFRVNLVDLGLIYDVQVDDDHVNVVMTLTARGCPAHSFISEAGEAAGCEDSGGEVRKRAGGVGPALGHQPLERGGKEATGA